MADSVVIKINGDIKNFTDALEKAQGKTEELEGALKKTATISGIAFAALTAEVGLSVAAFGESEKAANQLTAAMQAQGIYSEKLFTDYQRQATMLQNLSGVSDEAVTRAQTQIQGYLGQIKVTDSLTLAIGNLSAAKNIDLETSAELIGKGINGQSAALKKLGIDVADYGNKELNLAEIIKKVNTQFEGQAEAAGKGNGAFLKLKETLGNLQEDIGSRFAPILQRAALYFNDLINAFRAHEELVNFTVAVIGAGIAVAAILTTVSVLGIAFLKLQAALVAVEAVMGALGVAVSGLVAATGLGLLLVLVTEIYLHWNAVWPRMQATFKSFVDNIGSLGTALATILKGIYHMDKAEIMKGLDDAKNAFVSGYKEYGEIVESKMKEQAEKEAEIEEKKVAKNRVVRQTNDEKDLADRRLAYEATLAQNEEFQALSADQKAKFHEDNDKKNIENQETVTSSKRLYAEQTLQQEQEAHKRFLIEQQKYGTAYATMSKAMHSEIYQGTKSAFADLADLQQSSNSTLKTIGKAAAIANIIIKTGESAMNIFAGFSTIPFIGPALGVAGAAAAIAFGGEQIGRVTGAAQGGLITGGIAGVDSVPVLAQRNELISPAQNFDEVIGSVRASREAQKLGGSGDNGGVAQVILELKGDLMDFIEAKIVERQRIGISILGTV